jgi:hypothetical protein
MPHRVHGTITIKAGKVTFLKNVSDLTGAIVGDGDLARILNDLAQAGWKLDGDYALQISEAAPPELPHPEKL